MNALHIIAIVPTGTAQGRIYHLSHAFLFKYDMNTLYQLIIQIQTDRGDTYACSLLCPYYPSEYDEKSQRASLYKKQNTCSLGLGTFENYASGEEPPDFNVLRDIRRLAPVSSNRTPKAQINYCMSDRNEGGEIAGDRGSLPAIQHKIKFAAICARCSSLQDNCSTNHMTIRRARIT